jgi:DNA replication protein DnaC
VRDFEKTKLKELIDSALGGNAHRVVSVCGIAGVGKSFLVKSIVKNVYKDRLKNCAWASAPHPFDIVDLCRSFDNIPTSANGGDIVGQCWNHLEQKQWLVVIDDLRSKEDWDLIKANLISRASKSCIIVITREESVARHCATLDNAVCIVKGLEADVALRLFEEVRPL